MPVPASLPRGHRACRRLDFGMDEESDAAAPAPPRLDLERMLAEERARAAARWNFDFQSEEPLPGPYEWERVGAASPSSAQAAAPPSVEAPNSGDASPPPPSLSRPSVEPPTPTSPALAANEVKVEDEPGVVVDVLSTSDN